MILKRRGFLVTKAAYAQVSSSNQNLDWFVKDLLLQLLDDC